MIDTTDMTEAQKARLELFIAFANEESKAKSERALRGWETRRKNKMISNPLLGYNPEKEPKKD